MKLMCMIGKHKWHEKKCSVCGKELSKEEIEAISQKMIKFAGAGSFGGVAQMLEAGADINSKDKDNYTALMLASGGNSLTLVNFLLDKGADVNAISEKGSALMMAANLGHIKIMKLLIYKGADVNAKDDKDTTALMCVSRDGYADIAELLIDKGADVNAKDGQLGLTALMLAVISDHYEVVKLFIYKGADLKIKDKKGLTALTHATLSNKGFGVSSLLRDAVRAAGWAIANARGDIR